MITSALRAIAASRLFAFAVAYLSAALSLYYLGTAWWSVLLAIATFLGTLHYFRRFWRGGVA